MRITVVSDVHGNFTGLAKVAAAAEQLVILGDLLDYVDYHHPERGILGTIFGADRVRHFADLRFSGEFGRLHRYNTDLWSELADPIGVLTEVVRARYHEVLQVVGPSTLLTLGNVDVAEVWNDVAGATLPYLDRVAVALDGRRFGFVAGGASRLAPAYADITQAWRPLVKPAAEYRADVAGPGRRGRAVQPRPARPPDDALRRGARAAGDGGSRATGTHRHPAPGVGALRSRPPAAGGPGPARTHRMRQRRAFPTHR